MKQLILSALLTGLFACSGDKHEGQENSATDSSGYETLSNDSLEEKLHKAEQLVKDDSTNSENEF